MILEVFEFHDRQRLERDAPVEFGSFLVEFLLLLLNTTLLNLIGSKLFEIVGETELLPHPYGPLGRIILVPLDSIAVVGGEFVVEVVITLTKCDKGSNNMVPGRVAVIKRLVTKPMSKRVDAECSLLDEEDAEDATIDETTEPVTPSKTTDQCGKDESHEEDNLEIMAMLPNNDWIFVEIRDVCPPNSLWVLLHQHPAEMRVEKTLADGIGVLFSVGISVVSTMVTSPPSHRALDGTATNCCKEDAEREGSGVGGMGPQSMIALIRVVSYQCINHVDT